MVVATQSYFLSQKVVKHVLSEDITYIVEKSTPIGYL